MTELVKQGNLSLIKPMLDVGNTSLFILPCRISTSNGGQTAVVFSWACMLILSATQIITRRFFIIKVDFKCPLQIPATGQFVPLIANSLLKEVSGQKAVKLGVNCVV